MIGYFISNFPKLSETFISREVLLLKKNKVQLKIYASEKPSSNDFNLLDQETKLLVNDVDYLIKFNVIFVLILNAKLFTKL